MGPRVRGDDMALCINRQTMTSRLPPALIAAIPFLALDQRWNPGLVFVLYLAHRGAVKVPPFFVRVRAWNVGISFGWFQNDSPFTQIFLMNIKADLGEGAVVLKPAEADPDVPGQHQI